MDDRLSLVVTHADGTTSRWAGDEVNGENVTTSLGFGTAITGGHTVCTTELLRSLQPRRDEALFDDVQVIAAGGEVVWQGRMQQLPRDASSIKPAAVGYSAALKDDGSFREIYVDQDLGRWNEPPVDHKVALLTSGSPTYPQNGSVGVAAGGLVMVQGPLDNTSGTVLGVTEAWYDAAGVQIARLDYAAASYYKDGTALISGWHVEAGLGAGTTLGFTDLGTNVYANGSGTLTATAARNTAQLRMYYNGTVAAQGPWTATWTTLRVYGNHGLTVQADGGIIGSDIIADVVARTAPGLTTTGITPSAFSIPQAAFLDATTADQVIATINAYHGWEWGCWGRDFYWRPPAQDVVWNARLDEGAAPSLEGDTADDVLTGVMVTYQLGDGTRRTAGPTGSTADVTSALLEASGNPASDHGIRRIATLPLSNPTTDDGAVVIGAAYLAEQNLAARAGTITVTGSCQREGSARFPVSKIKAGDYVRLADRVDDPPRRIISTSYDHSTRTVTLEVGSKVVRVDALLARLDARTA